MEKILEINNLTKHYGRIKAVSNLNLEVEQGQVYGILGPNGSGKTTTLAIITGILRQNSGSFLWFGKEGDNPVLRRKIGSLIEGPSFYPYLNLSDNLRIIAGIKDSSPGNSDNALKITGLYKRRHSPYRTLSLGMKQRLALASILLSDPEVMVLDEPANGLDPEGIAEVREIILNEAHKGKTIILASHILAEVEKVCTHALILKEGELLACGRVDQLLGGKQVYLVAAGNIRKLEELLQSWGNVESVSSVSDGLIVTCSGSTTPADLNRYAFDHDFVLTKLLPVKKSLESQFLELVK